MRCLIPGVAAAALTAATPASAQPAPPPAAIEEPSRGWSALAGYEVFSLRDISRNIKPWVRANRARVPRLADLADDEKWNSHSTEGYRSSASFLAFLLARYGATPLKQLYYARSDDFARRASEIYGKSLEALETEWLASI